MKGCCVQDVADEGNQVECYHYLLYTLCEVLQRMQKRPQLHANLLYRQCVVGLGFFNPLLLSLRNRPAFYGLGKTFYQWGLFILITIARMKEFKPQLFSYWNDISHYSTVLLDFYSKWCSLFQLVSAFNTLVLYHTATECANCQKRIFIGFGRSHLN